MQIYARERWKHNTHTYIIHARSYYTSCFFIFQRSFGPSGGGVSLVYVWVRILYGVLTKRFAGYFHLKEEEKNWIEYYFLCRVCSYLHGLRRAKWNNKNEIKQRKEKNGIVIRTYTCTTTAAVIRRRSNGRETEPKTMTSSSVYSASYLSQCNVDFYIIIIII